MTLREASPIQLTIIGSSCATVRAMPAALERGGVQIETICHAGSVLERRSTLSLTADQASRLVEQITSALAAVDARG